MDARRNAIEKLVQAESVIRKVLPVDDDRLRRALASGRWSPAEHALHCALVFEATAEAFRRAQVSAALGPPPGDFTRALARRLLFTTWRIPRGAQAPRHVEPLVILPRAELLVRLESARDQMVDLVDLTGRPRAALWVEHPRLGAMGFDDWLTFLLIHARHHRRILLEAGA